MATVTGHAENKFLCYSTRQHAERTQRQRGTPCVTQSARNGVHLYKIPYKHQMSEVNVNGFYRKLNRLLSHPSEGQ